MLPERFTSKFIITKDGHWIWTAYRNKAGYGKFEIDEKIVNAHRFAWQEIVGPIPQGLELCHKNSCNRKDCINPEHLYLGTHKQNMKDLADIGTGRMGQNNKDKTHCPQGHEYNEVNTYITKKGLRECKTCRKERNRLYRINKNLL